jgi:predicted metalloprotease with PDZ domain
MQYAPLKSGFASSGVRHMAGSFRFLSLAAAIAFAFGAGGAAPAPAPAAHLYEIAAAADAGVLRGLDITLTFTGEADGQTLLALPNEWGGEEDLWRALRGLSVEGGVLRDGAQPQFKLIDHAPGAALKVRYRVVADPQSTDDPVASDRYRPLVRDGFGLVLGHAAFVWPALPPAAKVRVNFTPPPAPWRFASDLQHADAFTEQALRSSVIAVGAFDVLSPQGGPNGLRIAIADGLPISSEALAESVGAIVRAQRAFWGTGEEPYLVTVTPFAPPAPGWQSMGGAGLNDGFALYVTSNVPLSRMTRILAHESLHTWIPFRIGAMPEGQAEAGAYFISEGFTEFMTDRLLVRVGFWGPQDFADSLNAMLLEYGFLPARTAPNSEIAARFWRDGAIQRLPYLRGRLFAEILDGAVRRVSGGRKDMDDVLLGMQLRPADPIEASLMQGLRALGVRAENLRAAHIDGGAPILLAGDHFASCGTIETLETGPFALGFVMSPANGNLRTITRLEPQSNAALAGLREGMQVRRVVTQARDPSQTAVVTVQHPDGRLQDFDFIPAAPGPKSRWQRLRLDDLSAPQIRAACLARIAGFG